MLKTIGFLFKKIKEYDFFMIPIMVIYTMLFAVYPFIWVIVPTKVISLSKTNDISMIIKMILVGGALAIICVIGTSFLKGNYRMRMNNVRYNLIRDLMNYSLTMPYEYTLEPEKLTEIELADKSIISPMHGAGAIILTMLTLFGSLFATLGFIGLMSTLSWGMMIFLFLVVVGTYFFSSKAASYEESTWDKWGNYERQYNQTINIMTDGTYGKDIRLYNLIDILEKYCNNLISQFKTISTAVSKKNHQMSTASAILNLLRDIVLFSYISNLLLTRQIDASQFFLYTTGMTSFVVILQDSMKQIANIKKESNRFTHFINLVKSREDIAENTESIKMIEHILSSRPITIDIVDVSFRYPRTEKDTLNNLNLTIKAGEKMALVGENGAGKSTLIKLLCKLYKPSSGKILLNGIDIDEIPEKMYWQILGVVFQDAMVLPFSVKDNITLDEKVDIEKLNKAINSSGMDEVADKLADGIDTILLRILNDNGLDISGGQRQKLYLARALYKECHLLILDEPTAALDPLAEASLYQQYDLLADEKTSLYISHRLASTKFCNRIAYLKDGKITELGTHDELMNLNGDYKELFDIQAKYYKESNEMGVVTI